MQSAHHFATPEARAHALLIEELAQAGVHARLHIREGRHGSEVWLDSLDNPGGPNDHYVLYEQVAAFFHQGYTGENEREINAVLLDRYRGLVSSLRASEAENACEAENA